MIQHTQHIQGATADADADQDDHKDQDRDWGEHEVSDEDKCAHGDLDDFDDGGGVDACDVGVDDGDGDGCGAGDSDEVDNGDDDEHDGDKHYNMCTHQVTLVHTWKQHIRNS